MQSQTLRFTIRWTAEHSDTEKEGQRNTQANMTEEMLNGRQVRCMKDVKLRGGEKGQNGETYTRLIISRENKLKRNEQLNDRGW